MPSPAEVAAALAYADALVRDGQAHSPFGAALLTLAAAVRGLTDQRDSYKAAYDELNVRLAGVEAERDHFRTMLTTFRDDYVDSVTRVSAIQQGKR